MALHHFNRESHTNQRPQRHQRHRAGIHGSMDFGMKLRKLVILSNKQIADFNVLNNMFSFVSFCATFIPPLTLHLPSLYTPSPPPPPLTATFTPPLTLHTPHSTHSSLPPTLLLTLHTPHPPPHSTPHSLPPHSTPH